VLKKIRIERFRSIHEQTLEFGRVNLFVGSNGSGKSNVLEALGVLSAALSQGIDPTTLDYRGVRLSLPSMFKSAFKNHALPKTFSIEAQFEHGRYLCGIRAGQSSSFLEFFSESLFDGDRQVFGRSMHGTKLHSVASDMPGFSPEAVDSTRSVWSVISPFVTISKELREELEEFSNFAIYAPQTAVMRGLAIDPKVIEPLGLTGSGLPAALNHIQRYLPVAFVNELLKVVWQPGWTNRITTGPHDSKIIPGQVRSEGMLLYMRDRYMHSDRNMLSAFDASEGTLYLIFVATLLGHPETPNTFALDNVDGTLNPRLVRSLMEHVVSLVCGDLISNNHQVFMTSHHPSSLDSIDIFDERQRIFVCHRNTSANEGVVGSSDFRPLLPPTSVSKEDWNLKHKGRNLSELFLGDRIPNAL
jgi:energy-coupling factor transporter ATP-binding protein EcfA2